MKSLDNTTLRIGPWRVDPSLDEISKDGKRVKLEPRAMRLLICLAEHARKLLDGRRLQISHLDAVVICEHPKLGPHFPAMRAALAKSLGITAEQINLKAKTNEGSGEIGRGEAIAAHAIATLEG